MKYHGVRGCGVVLIMITKVKYIKSFQNFLIGFMNSFKKISYRKDVIIIILYHIVNIKNKDLYWIRL